MLFPKWMFHKDLDPREAKDENHVSELRALGFQDNYVHREYPKKLYKDVEVEDEKGKVTHGITYTTVTNPDEEATAIADGHREDVDPSFPLDSDSRFSH